MIALMAGTPSKDYCVHSNYCASLGSIMQHLDSWPKKWSTNDVVKLAVRVSEWPDVPLRTGASGLTAEDATAINSFVEKQKCSMNEQEQQWQT